MKANRIAPALFAFILMVGPARADFIAYNLAPMQGNQNFGGAVGLDFDVTGARIAISSLGVFDSGANGLTTTLTVTLYDRVTQQALIQVQFTPDAPGTLAAGSSFRFKELPSQVFFQQGRQLTIVASGFNAENPLYNRGRAPTNVTTNNGGGLITFVTTSPTGVQYGGRYGSASNPSAYPTTLDGMPSPRYGAGTFIFAVPEPSSVVLTGLGAVGLLALARRRLAPAA